jgi:hypothetical protein
VLQPSLKEAAWASVLGSLAVLVAVTVCLSFIVSELSHVNAKILAPQPSWSTIVEQYGTLSIAYGAATAIPSLHKITSDSSRLAYVCSLTLFIIALIFLSTAVVGYSLIGCQVSGNIVFGLFSNSYGTTTPRWVVVTSFSGMLLHIVMAFGIVLHPALYVIENYVFGDEQDKLKFQDAASQVESGAHRPSTTPLLVDDTANTSSPMKRNNSSFLRSLISMADTVPTPAAVVNEERTKTFRLVPSLNYIIFCHKRLFISFRNVL